MKPLLFSAMANRPTEAASGASETSQATWVEAGRGSPSAWNETELTEAILTVCDETPAARMVACWRTLEHCRRWTPHGTPESLVAAMRETLHRDIGSSETAHAVAV
jgi:hypothetical protein